MSPAKNQPNKSSHENLASLDRVVELALELKELNDRHDLVERALLIDNGSASRKTYAHNEIEQLGRRGDALREGISAFKAQTIPGALVHISELEVALDYLDSDNEFESKKVRATIERLASSVKSVLMAATPKSLLEMLPELNEHLDRWAPFEERLETVQRCNVKSATIIAQPEIDPIIELITEHKARTEFANKRGLSEDEVARRSDLADDAWWALVDAEPKTVNGAAELARYVAETEEGDLCPTSRVSHGPREHGSTIALRRIAVFIARDRDAPASGRSDRCGARNM